MPEPSLDQRISLFVESARKARRGHYHMVALPAWMAALVPLVWVVAGGGFPGVGSMILAVLLGWGTYTLTRRLMRGRGRRMHVRLAGKFQQEFAAASAGYEPALARLIRGHRKEKVVKAMLEHLPGADVVLAETGGGAVWYDAVKSSASKPGKAQAGLAGQMPSQGFDAMFETMGMPGMGSFESKEELLEMVKNNPNLKATFSEGTTADGGTFTTVRIVRTSSSLSQTVGGKIPADPPGPVAEPPAAQAELPEPGLLLAEDPPRKTEPPAPDRPAYIPLDPFEPGEGTKDE